MIVNENLPSGIIVLNSFLRNKKFFRVILPPHPMSLSLIQFIIRYDFTSNTNLTFSFQSLTEGDIVCAANFTAVFQCDDKYAEKLE